MQKKSAKVAVLATVAGYGGAEKVVLSLIENISAELYELVPIIFTRPTQTGNKFFVHLDKIQRKYYKIPLNSYKFKYLNPLVNILEAYKLLKRDKLHLIHTHGYRADILGGFAARLMGLPIISTCHGYISSDTNLMIYNVLDRIALRFFNRVIAVSGRIKSELIRSGIKESRIQLIPNAVAIDIDNATFTGNGHEKRQLFHIGQKDFVLGYVGRLSEEKGLKHLIEAASMLKGEGLPIRVLLIGDGPQRNELENLVKKRSLGHNVTFVGFQSNVENWIPVFDVFALPSLTEGTPMALLEAMAYGIPVVASAVGGVPQILESGKNGILVQPGNVVGIKDAIDILYHNQSLRESISKAGQDSIELKYNIKNWANKIEAEYLKVLDKLD